MTRIKLRERRNSDGDIYAYDTFLEGFGGPEDRFGYCGNAHHDYRGFWTANPAFGPGDWKVNTRMQFETAEEAATYLASCYGGEIGEVIHA